MDARHRQEIVNAYLNAVSAAREADERLWALLGWCGEDMDINTLREIVVDSAAHHSGFDCDAAHAFADEQEGMT